MSSTADGDGRPADWIMEVQRGMKTSVSSMHEERTLALYPQGAGTLAAVKRELRRRCPAATSVASSPRLSLAFP